MTAVTRPLLLNEAVDYPELKYVHTQRGQDHDHKQFCPRSLDEGCKQEARNGHERHLTEEYEQHHDELHQCHNEKPDHELLDIAS
mmetsp:Transcript_117352/g.284659  ORF Transcript_117352/g.284659 Transcript_117352/m.284659 type:complete len:85 (-) Transcript_117352:465-719(-)